MPLAACGPAAAEPESADATPSGATAEESTQTPLPEPTEPNAYNPGAPTSCETWSAIRWDPVQEGQTSTRVWLSGPELVDAGPQEFAVGEVALDAEGKPATYTVSPGDSGLAIGERFCVDYITLFQFNDIYPFPHAGDVLTLQVDESVPFPVDPIVP